VLKQAVLPKALIGGSEHTGGLEGGIKVTSSAPSAVDVPCKISVIIPTYRRALQLRACLASLKGQQRLANEIVVVCRVDDAETEAMLKRPDWVNLPLIVVHPTESGVVSAYNTGIEAASCDIVAFTDDDAVALPDWLLRIQGAYAADSTLGGVGGRDRVYQNGLPVVGSRKVVGIMQRYGRVVGNHHLGVGPPREVDVLKGVNMSFRRAAIGGTRFDKALRGIGAQSDCELAFCLALRRRGMKLVYDPSIVVQHFPAVRHDNDHRIALTIQTQVDQAFNETITVLDHLGPVHRTVFLLWALLIGTRAVPGVLQICRLPFLVPTKPLRCIPASFRGRILGVRAWRRRTALHADQNQASAPPLRCATAEGGAEAWRSPTVR
jgi:GT2 family glycosyltransferase